MERGDEAVGADDAAGECVLSVWIERELVGGHAAQPGSLQREALVAGCGGSAGGNNPPQAAAFPRAGNAGGFIFIVPHFSGFHGFIFSNSTKFFLQEPPLLHQLITPLASPARRL